MGKQTVFVVDDDEAVRDSLGWLIESVGLRVAKFASAQTFLDAYDPNVDGCLLLDVRMPGMSGLELHEQLTFMRSPLPVIVITAHGDIPMAVRAMKAGAVDFVQKPFNDQLLLDAIHVALERGTRVRRSEQERGAIRKRLDRLTARERDVMGLVVDGRPNKVIAAELGITEKTVEAHRASVMRKMGVRSLAELVKLCMYALADTVPPDVVD